ncbi:NADH-quinone oxidoreductase subunit M [Buchnera aphidicola (Tetraneura ulmi)]|uniref:complex I subunit 4 family protein n=1 Tax=Buchnera aphidicola TaxID=9 RepID=UPI0034648D58
MSLLFLVIIPYIGGFFSFFLNRFCSRFSPRWNALFFTTSTFFLVIIFLYKNYLYLKCIKNNSNQWISEFIFPWIPQLGIDFHLAIDGLSLLMILLVSFLGVVSVLCSWFEKNKSMHVFYFHLLFIIGSVIGTFLSVDLFLFFCFWELTIIPIYFLIIFWGEPDKCIKDKNKYLVKVANKFVTYSLISGLLMLLSIFGLVINYYNISSNFSFDYQTLLKVSLDPNLELFLMICFFLSFIIKMPIVPFHSWLPDLLMNSPKSGSVDIVGIIIKTSLYGLLRFCVPLFPHSFSKIVPFAIFLGIFTAFYASWVAYSQTNIKRLIAYISISHMGMMLAAIYSGKSLLIYQGIVIQIIVQSLTTSALIIIFGKLYKKINSMNIKDMGGLWFNLNWLPGLSLFFLISNISIPGSGNFVGEFMTLLGMFKFSNFLSFMFLFLSIFSSLYSFNLMHRIYYGREKKIHFIEEKFITKSEFLIFFSFVFLILLIGIFPKLILDILYINTI